MKRTLFPGYSVGTDAYEDIKEMSGFLCVLYTNREEFFMFFVAVYGTKEEKQESIPEYIRKHIQGL